MKLAQADALPSTAPNVSDSSNRFPPIVERWIDAFCDTLDKTPILLEHHGTATMFTIGPIFVLVGYFGAHWINRRHFYRLKTRGDPFPTYAHAWRVSTFETSAAFFFVGLMMLGFVCLLAGAVDWVDG